MFLKLFMFCVLLKNNDKHHVLFCFLKLSISFIGQCDSFVRMLAALNSAWLSTFMKSPDRSRESENDSNKQYTVNYLLVIDLFLLNH